MNLGWSKTFSLKRLSSNDNDGKHVIYQTQWKILSTMVRLILHMVKKCVFGLQDARSSNIPTAKYQREVTKPCFIWKSTQLENLHNSGKNANLARTFCSKNNQWKGRIPVLCKISKLSSQHHAFTRKWLRKGNQELIWRQDTIEPSLKMLKLDFLGDLHLCRKKELKNFAGNKEMKRIIRFTNLRWEQYFTQITTERKVKACCEDTVVRLDVFQEPWGVASIKMWQ